MEGIHEMNKVLICLSKADEIDKNSVSVIGLKLDELENSSNEDLQKVKIK